MNDTEILELHNGCLRAQAKRAAEYKHVAVEVPLGFAQIEYVPDVTNGFQEVVCCAA